MINISTSDSGDKIACHKHEDQFYTIIIFSSFDLTGNKVSEISCKYCLKQIWQLANSKQKKVLESIMQNAGINDIE